MTNIAIGFDSIQNTLKNEMDRQFNADMPKALALVASENLRLVNLKVFPSMSEETVAFTATLKRGSKVIAYARNDGHGGCTWIDAAPDQRDALTTLERAWNAAIGIDQMRHACRYDLEAWINEAAYAKLNEAERKREEKRIARFVAQCFNANYAVCRIGDMWKSFGSRTHSRAELIAHVQAKNPEATDFKFPAHWVA